MESQIEYLKDRHGKYINRIPSSQITIKMFDKLSPKGQEVMNRMIKRTEEAKKRGEL